MEEFQSTARPASFYDAIIYSLDHIAKEVFKIIAPIPFAIGGTFYFGSALSDGDLKGMLVGGLVTVVSGAVIYHQYRKMEMCHEELLKSTQTDTKQPLNLETTIFDSEYYIIGDHKQLPLP